MFITLLIFYWLNKSTHQPEDIATLQMFKCLAYFLEKHISASSFPTLIWSGCVGLSIINAPAENRWSPFTPPRLEHNNRMTTERGLSACLTSVEAVVYRAAD